MGGSLLHTIQDLVRQLTGDERPREQQPPWEETVTEWLSRRPDLLADLRAVGRPDSCRPTGDHGLLEGLYALDRLSDLMIVPWSPPADPSYHDCGQTRSAWPDLMGVIGAVPIAEGDYHPFFHEIVDLVEADDPDAEPVLLDQHWPGAMLGSMVLKRAGVTVRAGSHHMDPAVATRSTLFWAWYRRTRPTTDLSVGWGSNSQWRTDFRRDYVLGAELHYNIDCRDEAGSVPTDDPMVELLRYRHGVLTDHGADEWPYSTTLVESRLTGGTAGRRV